MKKKFYIAIVALATMTMTSCYDVLEQSPTDRYTDAVVWDDPYLLSAHLAELYACTPVMVQDAVCLMNTWNGAPMNVDDNSWGAIMGFSVQMEGTVRTIEISDEAKYNFGGQAHILGVKENGIQANGTELQWWGNSYYTIRNLNNFIQKAGESSIDKVEERIGEARFLRAFCYFAMVKRYGGVPLITDVQSLDDDESVLYPKRNTEKEVFDFILQETKEIAEILPSKTDAGRASKWAALALRSRAALYAASVAQFGKQQLDGILGFPAGDAAKYYEICYEASNEIMTKSPHGLYNEDPDKVENFKNIFLKKGNIEAIMVKQHSGKGFQDGGSNRWSWDMVQCPRPNVWGVGNYNGPYLELVESFEYKDGRSGVIDREAAKKRLWTMDELWGDKDPRFFASIWTNGTSWPGAVGGVLGENTIDMHNGIMSKDGKLIDGRNDSYEGVPAIGDQLVRFKEGNTPNTGFGVMKYLDKEANNFNWFSESTTDYLIFRYAEILLNYAEAAFELGKTGDALNAINQIRDRAGISKLGSVDREKIRNERKVELVFENHRYWDLRRWRTAVKDLTRTYSGLRYIYDAASGKYRLDFIDNIDGRAQTPTFPEKNYYFPIGQGRIAANPNLVPNPGY
ncbi:RagB/SusD family nutrient uptake outer membrane protein [Dysgonomonas sp. Marseille-P4361]|uniref:RagB/SusD family nutrient uptake outer membrane protein n=1 Tax=Dysgonomonas sp. Marseille-P4361 TaxID=2161820 RepID=UPI000D55C619|nr:RagB/SusD family nutrient uptake outer membrane protein [Dysgonomonas sp. Marseille-P4361]